MSKILIDRAVVDQALEALEWADNAMYEGTPIQVNTQKAITALRAALAEQPEQEPVAWMVDVDLANYQGQSEYRTILSWKAKPVWTGTYEINEVLKAVPLYTFPPASKPLTDAEIGQVRWQCRWNRMSTDDNVVYATTQQLDAFANAIIAAYERKNGEQP